MSVLSKLKVKPPAGDAPFAVLAGRRLPRLQKYRYKGARHFRADGDR